jgi:hypothetical protein
MSPRSKKRSGRSPICPSTGRLKGRLSSCELFGIDAFAEDDLGYAPS